MSKKNDNQHSQKRKLTKKEQKALNHAKLMEQKKGGKSTPATPEEQKKAA